MKTLCYVFFFITLLAVSCIKDKSEFNINHLDEVTIDTTGLPKDYTVFQNDSLIIVPKITLDGKESAKLKFNWTINAYGGYERLLGTRADLKALITEIPSPTSYTLILRATDSTNNVKAFFTWPIKVISPFGAGLVVADNKDGKNTDVHVIAAYNFTPDIMDDETTPKIIRNAYSNANGSLIQGIVNELQFAQRYSVKDVTFMTDKSLIRIDPNSYLKIAMDNDFFTIAPQRIAPMDLSTLNAVNPHQYIINNGKAYGRNTDGGWFVYPYLSSDNLDYQAYKIAGLQRPSNIQANGGVLYDELNNRFMLIPSVINVGTNPVTPFPTTNTTPAPAFDPHKMGDKTCLKLFEGYNDRIIAIMKERSQDKLYAYQIKITNPATGGMGIGMHDLNALSDIKQAKYFTCSMSEEVLFYGTESKVYTTSIQPGTSATSALRYSCPAGEKITGMKMYTGIGGSGYINIPSTSDPTDWSKRVQMSAANRMLILSTYNESTKEGKIVTIPIQTLGNGGLVTDPAYISSYGGFGYITAFDAQL